MTSERAERILDVAVSGVLLVVLSPALLTSAVAVRRDSPGPILHRASRMGRDGRLFTLYKFRTMIPAAASSGPSITAAADPRITRVGAVLRRTKLDELPQLWNVLRGDMGLVGPRPEDPRFLQYYRPEHHEVLSVRPGITGPAQLVFFDEEQLLGSFDPETVYVLDVLPRKLSIDLEYARHHAFRDVLRILTCTVATALRRAVCESAAASRGRL